MKKRLGILLSVFVILGLLLPSVALYARNRAFRFSPAFAKKIGTAFRKPIAKRPFWLPSVFAKKIIASRRARIDKLISQRKFAEAERSATNLANTLKNYRLSAADTRKIQADIYRTQLVTSQEKQGKYSYAATTIRKALAIQKDPKDIGKLIKLQINDRKQKQKFNLIKKHNRKLSGLYETKLPYLRKKIVAVNKLLQAKNVTAKDMKALQTKLKAYSKKLEVVNGKIKKEHKDFYYRLKKYQLSGVILTKGQNKKIAAEAQAKYKMLRETYKMRAEVAKSLTKITEKFKYSWNNLKEDFKKLEVIQRKALGLKKQIAAMLAMKKILTDGDKAKLKKLRDELQKTLGEEAKLYKEVEKAFIDQRKFANLSPRDQGTLSQMFSNAWRNNKAIYKNKPTPRYLFTEIKKRLDQKPLTPISIYDKMIIKALFGADAVRVEYPNKFRIGGATKYFDKNGKLICTKNASLGPGRMWMDANGKPVTAYISATKKVSQNDPNYKRLSSILNAFPTYKITRYGLGKDGFMITEIIFAKDGTMIGRHIKTYRPGSPYPKEVWLDRNGKVVDQIIRIDDPKPMPKPVRLPATGAIDIPVGTYTNDFPVATYTENGGDVNNEIAGDDRADTDKIDNTNDSGSTSSNSNLMDSF